MSKYTVIFDACVLYPAPLRDLLVQLATANLFRAKWTEKIHDEWVKNVLRDRDDLDQAKLNRTIDLMNSSVPDCLVSDYEYLIETIVLPDPDDRHVVEAAIASRADAIVTYNLKDFPSDKLEKWNLEAIHPDEFIMFQADLSEAAVVTAAGKVRSRLKNPVITAPEYLMKLRSMELPKTSAWLRQFSSVI